MSVIIDKSTLFTLLSYVAFEKESMNCQSWCTSQQNTDGIVLMFRNSSFTAWLAGKVSWTQLSKPAVLGTYKGKRLVLELEPLKGPFVCLGFFCLSGWFFCRVV